MVFGCCGEEHPIAHPGIVNQMDTPYRAISVKPYPCVLAHVTRGLWCLRLLEDQLASWETVPELPC